MELDVDIEFDDLEKLEEALEDGVDEGADDTLDWAMDEVEDKAQDVIWREGRIWNWRVYEEFVKTKTGNQSGVVHNVAPHAEIVEWGRPPGRAPQAQHIIEWVDDKVLANELQWTQYTGDNPEIQAMVDEHGLATTSAAFDIAQKIGEEGYSGIHYMQRAEQAVRQEKEFVAWSKVDSNLRRELRKRGFTVR